MVVCQFKAGQRAGPALGWRRQAASRWFMLVLVVMEGGECSMVSAVLAGVTKVPS